jgi:hypothetical protein
MAVNGDPLDTQKSNIESPTLTIRIAYATW